MVGLTPAQQAILKEVRAEGRRIMAEGAKPAHQRKAVDHISPFETPTLQHYDVLPDWSDAIDNN